MQSPTTYEEASLALNQFRERRLTERRATPRASADRRGAPTARADDVKSSEGETVADSAETTTANASS